MPALARRVHRRQRRILGIWRVYQRRRFTQRMIRAGLPADWDGLNWALMPRSRNGAKDLGPRPELIDAVLVSSTAVEDPGSWSGIIVSFVCHI